MVWGWEAELPEPWLCLVSMLRPRALRFSVVLRDTGCHAGSDPREKGFRLENFINLSCLSEDHCMGNGKETVRLIVTSTEDSSCRRPTVLYAPGAIRLCIGG